MDFGKRRYGKMKTRAMLEATTENYSHAIINKIRDERPTSGTIGVIY